MTLNQTVFKYLVFYPVVLARGEHVSTFLNQMEQSQWFSPAQLQLLQETKLLKIVRDVGQHVPYYQSRYQQNVEAVCADLKEFSYLPFVTKADIKAASRQFENPNFRGPVTQKTTGGSTGQPVTIRKSRESTAQEQAANWRGFRWAGIDIGHRQGRFWGVPHSAKDRLRARVIDWIANRRRCSAFSFSRDDMDGFTHAMNRFRPHYLYGYVSMLSEYARFLLQSNSCLDFPLQAVITTSEVLSQTDRELLESTFQTRVFNEYGCGEFGTIAHECEQGAMHLNSENLYVEVFSGSDPCGPDVVGELVVTDLNNRCMPLIRYRLGDYGALSSKPCPCGRSLPVIERLFGRAYDIVYNRQGQMFHGEFFMYIFEDVKRKGMGVHGFQVVQNDYDHFTVKLQTENGYSKETNSFIRQRIQEGYGSSNIEFEIVDHIPRERSGKMRLIVGMQSRQLASSVSEVPAS